MASTRTQRKQLHWSIRHPVLAAIGAGLIGGLTDALIGAFMCFLAPITLIVIPPSLYTAFSSHPTDAGKIASFLTGILLCAAAIGTLIALSITAAAWAGTVGPWVAIAGAAVGFIYGAVTGARTVYNGSLAEAQKASAAPLLSEEHRHDENEHEYDHSHEHTSNPDYGYEETDEMQEEQEQERTRSSQADIRGGRLSIPSPASSNAPSEGIKQDNEKSSKSSIAQPQSTNTSTDPTSTVQHQTSTEPRSPRSPRS